MRKLLSAIAIGLLASAFVVSATAIGKGPKSPKQVPGIGVGGGHAEHRSGRADTTTTVTGNVKSNSGCRKDRIVRFAYTGTGGTTQLGRDHGDSLERRLHRRPAATDRRSAGDGDAAGERRSGGSQGRVEEEGQEAEEGQADHLPGGDRSDDSDAGPIAAESTARRERSACSGSLAPATFAGVSEERFSDLLAAARAGDEHAWERDLRGLAPIVLGYLRANGAPDPEDVLGETFLQVARDISRFEGDESSFRSWVFTIAHHRLIDARRYSARRPIELAAEPPEPAERGG